MSELKHDQHFLANQEVLKAIIANSRLHPNDTVLEIGAGKGILTRELAKHCKEVIAIELDEELKPNLENLPKNAGVIFGNALKLVDKIEFNKIVSNIPYSISEPLLKKMLKADFELAILLVGKDFYELFSGESKWNLVGKLFFDITKIMDVARESFEPKPRVDSVLLKFEKTKRELTKNESIIKEFVLQDDKLVKNALMFAFMRMNSCTKKQAKEQISKLGIEPKWMNKRVEHLSNVQFKVIIYEKIMQK